MVDITMIRIDSGPNRRGFAEALSRARLDCGISQAEAGRHLREKFGEGGQSTISDWEGGTRVPDPPELFELERLYGVKPGGLSVHLGYVPVTTLTFTNMEQAIIADPNLSEVDKRLLLRSYRSAVDEPLA